MQNKTTVSYTPTQVAQIQKPNNTQCGHQVKELEVLNIDSWNVKCCSLSGEQCGNFFLT